MARLTWQNVSAPDFTPAMRGIQNATTLLSNAFNSASDAVGQFQGMQADTADRAILSRLANVQDPSQFDANTIIGSDGSRASTAMLKSVADRPGTLLDWATRRGAEERAQANQRFTDWGNTRTQESAARMDAAGPDAQRYWSLLQQGKTAEANSLLGSSPALKALNAAEYNQIAGTGDSYTNRENAAYSRDRSRKEDAFNDSAAADAETLRNMGVGLSPENDEFLINALKWDPRRTQRALSYAGLNRGGQSGGAGASGSFGSLNPAVGAAISNLSSKYPDVAPSTMAAMSMIESSGGNAPDRAGSQYQGVFQLGSAVRNQYGVTNSQDANQNTEAAYKLAQTNATELGKTLNVPANQVPPGLIYLAHQQGLAGAKALISAAQNGTPISALPADLQRNIRSNIPESQRGNITTAADFVKFYDGKMAQYADVSNGLDRITHPSISSRENATTRDRINRSQIGTLVPQYESTMANTNDPVEAAQLLQKQFGGDVGTLTSRIRKVMADGVVNGQAKINAATAAAIIQSSLNDGTKGLDLWGLSDWFNNNSLGGGGFGAGNLSIDSTVRDELVRQAKTDGFRRLIQTNENEVNAQNTVNAATQRTAQIEALLRQAIAAKSSGRSGMDPLIERLTHQRDASAAASSAAARSLALLQAPTDAEKRRAAEEAAKAEAAKRPEPKPLTPEVRAQLERSRDEIDRRFPVY